jgi:hypothetical protein
MLFLADEHVEFDEARDILGSRGHILQRGKPRDEDLVLLAAAERDGAIMLTADRWFYTQLRRVGHVRSIYRRAGVVRLPGEWAAAAAALRYWLPLIEVAYELMQEKRDKRLVVEIRSSTILIDA